MTFAYYAADGAPMTFRGKPVNRRIEKSLIAVALDLEAYLGSVGYVPGRAIDLLTEARWFFCGDAARALKLTSTSAKLSQLSAEGLLDVIAPKGRGFKGADVTRTKRFLFEVLAKEPGWREEDALFRGRLVTFFSAHSVPVDVDAFEAAKKNLPTMREFIREHRVDDLYQANATLNSAAVRRLARDRGFWLKRLGSSCATPGLNELKTLGRVDPVFARIATVEELRAVRKLKLKRGQDGHVRVWPRPFAATTGRCAPPPEYPFAAPGIIRQFIRPAEGHIVGFDYSALDLVGSAAESRDLALLAATESSDPYSYLARKLGVGEMPREKWKIAALSLFYGTRAPALAARLGCSNAEAQELIDTHRRHLRRFWQWSDEVIDRADGDGYLLTPRGWRRKFPGGVRGNAGMERKARNFAVQARTSEVALEAFMEVAEQTDLPVVGTAHDAVYLHVPPDVELEDALVEVPRILGEVASERLQARARVKGCGVVSSAHDCCGVVSELVPGKWAAMAGRMVA